MREPAGYAKFWRDINRTLWRCAVDGVAPRDFVRAEMWKRVEQMRLLEKSALYRVSQPKVSDNAVYRACRWIVASGARTPSSSAFYDIGDVSAPENDAVPAHWPKFYPGVDTALGGMNSGHRRDEPDNYQVFANGFFYAAKAAEFAGISPQSFSFEFIFSKDRWRVHGDKTRPITNIQVNFFYLSAGPKIWNALFAAIVKKDAQSRKIAEKYAQTTQAQKLLAVYSDISPLRINDVYDLNRMFDELNAEYFNDALLRPMIAWTTRPTYRQLGSYNFFWDIICLSSILNDARVPEPAVRFVLFHEMVHIKHGARQENRRFKTHTPEFRADEALFRGKDEAEEICKHLREIVELGASGRRQPSAACRKFEK